MAKAKAKRKLAHALQAYKAQKVDKAAQSVKAQRTKDAQLLKLKTIKAGSKHKKTNTNTPTSSNIGTDAANVPEHSSQSNAWLPFQPEHKLLLVGEGDFSFAVSLLENKLCSQVVATCLDSENDIAAKYPDSGPNHIARIREFPDCEAVCSIDATKLTKNKRLRQLNTSSKGPQQQRRPFDACVFNFPHLGNSIADQNRNIRQHQQLLLDFFQSAIEFLVPPANIIVTTFEGEPYDSWKIKALARSKGLYLEQSGKFPWSRFPEYNHMLTAKKGQTSKPQKERPARIYHFSLEQRQTKKKKTDDAGSDDDP